MTTRHQVAFVVAAYLALFATYGYQIALTARGVLCRRQFFFPNAFVSDMPTKSQMLLMGAPQQKFSEETKVFWTPPFKFTFDNGFCLVGVRNAVGYLPVSRDPETPIAHVLPYAPPRHSFKADFTAILL